MEIVVAVVSCARCPALISFSLVSLRLCLLSFPPTTNHYQRRHPPTTPPDDQKKMAPRFPILQEAFSDSGKREEFVKMQLGKYLQSEEKVLRVFEQMRDRLQVNGTVTINTENAFAQRNPSDLLRIVQQTNVSRRIIATRRQDMSRSPPQEVLLAGDREGCRQGGGRASAPAIGVLLCLVPLHPAPSKR